MVNHKRTLRLMREGGLLWRGKRRLVVRTASDHPDPLYPNLVAGSVPQGPDEVWVADITYIRLPSRFIYLATILDAYSRKCVGYNIDRGLGEELVLGALGMAAKGRTLLPGLIHHSDQGAQYRSKSYQERLLGLGIRISMSRRGNPYENAIAESFYRTLKCEEVELKHYQTLGEARENIAQYIDEVYNQKRLHSSLGYRSPTEFEALYYQST